MPKYYDQVLPVPWDEDAVIFTRVGSKQAWWSVRIKRKFGKNNYYVQSLKTTSPELAMEKCRDVIHKLRLAEFSGYELTNKNFVNLFNVFVATLPAATSAKRHARIHQISLDFFHFFHNVSLSQVNNKAWLSYLDWRVSEDRFQFRRERLKTINANSNWSGRGKGNNLKRGSHQTTLNSERQLLIQFLRWAKKQQHISNVPLLDDGYGRMPALVGKVRLQRQSAKSLDNFTFQSVMTKLRYYSYDENSGHPYDKYFVNNKGARFARLRLFHLVQFLYGSLIRIQEVKYIKHRDVSVGHTDDGLPYCLIYVPRAKMGGDRYSVLSAQKYQYYEEWMRVKEEFKQPAGKDDYLFCNYKPQYEYWGRLPTSRRHGRKEYDPMLDMSLVGRQFRTFCKVKGCGRDRSNQKVSLMSLTRHSAISHRIAKNGANVGDVATMAGNSLQQISSVYFDQFVIQEAGRFANQSPKDRAANWGVREANIDRVLRSAGVRQNEPEPEPIVSAAPVLTKPPEEPPAPSTTATRQDLELSVDDWDRWLAL